MASLAFKALVVGIILAAVALGVFIAAYSNNIDRERGVSIATGFITASGISIAAWFLMHVLCLLKMPCFAK